MRVEWVPTVKVPCENCEGSAVLCCLQTNRLAWHSSMAAKSETRILSLTATAVTRVSVFPYTHFLSPNFHGVTWRGSDNTWQLWVASRKEVLSSRNPNFLLLGSKRTCPLVEGDSMSSKFVPMQTSLKRWSGTKAVSASAHETCRNARELSPSKNQCVVSGSRY